MFKKAKNLGYLQMLKISKICQIWNFRVIQIWLELTEFQSDEIWFELVKFWGVEIWLELAEFWMLKINQICCFWNTVDSRYKTLPNLRHGVFSPNYKKIF
jgi:hypothetical protein